MSAATDPRKDLTMTTIVLPTGAIDERATALHRGLLAAVDHSPIPARYVHPFANLHAVSLAAARADRSARRRAAAGRPARQPCVHLEVDVRTPLPAGQRDGEELERWARHMVAALADVPEIRQVYARGRGGTRRQLSVAVRPPEGVSGGEHLRSLIERFSGELRVLPACPSLAVHAREGWDAR